MSVTLWCTVAIEVNYNVVLHLFPLLSSFNLLYGNEFFRVVFAGPGLEAYCFCPLVLLTGRTTIMNYFGYK